MIHRTFIRIMMILLTFSLSAQKIKKVEPPFWWAGMNNPELQLMIYGEELSDLNPEILYPGVDIIRTTKVENKNYLVIDLNIMDAEPGSFQLNLKKGKRVVASYQYELASRRAGSKDRQGFNSSDVMYLITPDRFANGNAANDNVEGLKEVANRQNKGGRHGGDIQGIIDHLDYIDDMGFTAIWVNPVLENDMAVYSYHGYSTTDFYKVDPRFGSNKEYAALSRKAKESGIKMIMDMIVNHNGSEHWWMKDLPTSDWVNYQEEYLKGEYKITSHKKAVIQDPYVAQTDIIDFTDGWFVKTMPDLNQRNPFMAKYLIQNAIWWVEFADLDGIRMDTYPYSGKEFMAEWSCAVMNEYPNLNIVGEEWVGDVNWVAHWQEGKENPNGYESCLPSLMDFPLQEMLAKALIEPDYYYNQFSSTIKGFGGLNQLYGAVAMDFVYADPFNLVVFPDNHDMSRFYSQLNEDYNLFKLGITFFLTTRGIPQIYYGTEILMSSNDDHGIIRSDFPGGWKGDEVNAFSGEGLSDQQQEAQDFFKTVMNWRKTSDAIINGQLIHYAPKENVYVYFRYTENDQVMVVLSKNDKDVNLSLDRFNEILEVPGAGKEIITGVDIDLNGSLLVPAMGAMIIDL